MNRLGQKKIRKTYYFGAFIIVIVLALVTSIPYYSTLTKEFERKSQQLSESMIDHKKLYIKTIITERFADIASGRSLMVKNENDKARILLKTLSTLLLDNGRIIEVSQWENILDSLDLGEFEYGIGNSLNLEHIKKSEAYPVIQSLNVNKDLTVYIYLSNDRLDDLMKEALIDRIRATQLPDNGYIWINQILNYEGGDDYAIRLVHPNLPETEGKLLSTNTEDIMGNKPYLEELEGVKNTGEVFLDYYFQKKDSEKITHKITYARLYEDYDWVIATGIYLDDVDQLVLEETKILKKTLNKNILLIFVFTFIITAVALIAVIHFEKLINHLITDYGKTIDKEKHKVEAALTELQKIAYKDPLTNLLNRRAMYDRLHEEISRSNRSGTSFCLILGDIDLFKQINDNYGHSMGDRILKELSGILIENIRLTDSVSRWGGEEFLILIGSAGILQGQEAADKLRKMISRNVFGSQESPIKVTMTFGVALFNPGDTLEHVIHHADENLYEGKRSGRNKVIS